MQAKILFVLSTVAFLGHAFITHAQYAPAGSDVTTPLHLLKPDYPMPYEAPAQRQVMQVVNRVFTYLDAATPFELYNKKTGAKVVSTEGTDSNIVLKTGDFRLTSYEWGVTYSAMLRLADATGENRFAEYTHKRVAFLARFADFFKKQSLAFAGYANPLKQVTDPHALDDAGAVCAAMIKANRMSPNPALEPLIQRYADYISNKEFRLPDGTLARNRPFKNTLWLDDLYMSVPALGQMGSYSNNARYYDDAVKQVLQFSKRMFNPQLNLYMHGWVEAMQPHPEFRWGRANGWAIMAMSELLDVLPVNHPGYQAVLQQFRNHAAGIAARQSGSGFWHQLLDRPDSYLETSATAIYAYCFAHGINKGWLDAKAFGPAAILAWNAVSTKVNAKGQVEGTCVGTGMGFEPAFYYHRPVNPYAAHGYGPVLLAAADIMILLKNKTYKLNDSALMFTEN